MHGKGIHEAWQNPKVVIASHAIGIEKQPMCGRAPKTPGFSGDPADCTRA
jgi:hypothetical protein